MSKLRYTVAVRDEIQFDWDKDNRLHLASHSVSPTEFEQVIWNEPVDLEYQSVTGETDTALWASPTKAESLWSYGQSGQTRFEQ